MRKAEILLLGGGLAGLCAILSGCGLMAAKERQEAIAVARAEQETIFAECDAKFPKARGNFVNRAKCRQPGLELYAKLVPYPDLLQQDIAMRMVMAEKLDAGQITVAQAELEGAQAHSQIVAEEQRRSLAMRSVNAQESAAAAAWKGTTCSRVGNTVNCF
jgi:hypothetical protein